MPRMSGLSGSALGFASSLVLITGEVVLGASRWPVAALAPALVLIIALSAATTLPGALFAAAQCWGLYAGFVLGHSGQLALTDRSAAAAGALLCAALLGSLLGVLIRFAGRWRADPGATGWPLTAWTARTGGNRGWAAAPGAVPAQRSRATR